MLELWLSIGRHRKETNWKNVKFTWPDLLARLSKCQYTGETVKEYAGMDKDQQAAIKDIGGFVGGVINGGRRKKGAVTSRSLITLDADTVESGFWDRVTLDYGFTMACYSTHKHTPESPRLRLIIPLDREVLPDEYEAISRKIAYWFGLDNFDPTTFQPERLMYWPSMPKDGEFFFDQQTGPVLEADKILGAYKDWKDVSQWPVHPGEARQIHEGVKMAADPTEKPGIVGAFCRVFGITAAIEKYLPTEYIEAGDGRYTYTGGSTAAGLVVYDDKFAYSHHGTDPCGGMLCNAFDLVRLHKYGRMDDRCKEDTPINKRPSFAAMADLARQNSEVNLDIVKQQTGRAQEAFADEPERAADVWLKLLETDRRGKIVATSGNLLIIMRNDPNLSGRFGLNEFTSREMVFGKLPWHDGEEERPWSDLDDAGLRWYIETTYGFTAVNKIVDCLAMIMQDNHYHPVRQYLQGLNWDGVNRIESMLCYYLGAQDSDYTRAVSRKMMVAAVSRIMTPGIKFDNAAILIGDQGSGKSSFIRILGGQWYSDSFGRLDRGNQAVENIQGVWLMEIPELAAFKNAEVEDIKHFLSKSKDDFRPAYGRRVQSFLRQCVFWGTSNKFDFNKDQTGGRRFWPVMVLKDQLFKSRVYNELERARVQLWAEAVYLWREGEDLILPQEIEEAAEKIQEEHTERDPWFEAVEKYLDTPLPEKWDEMYLYDRKAYLRGDETQPKGTIRRNEVIAMEIWLECLEGDRKSLTAAIGRRISFIMRKIPGWRLSEDKKRFGVYGVCRYYFRENVADDDL